MQFRTWLVLGVFALAMGGCRFKSWESFESATTPNPPGEWKGDPYASAGLASSTGGLNTNVPYSKGAKVQTSPVNELNVPIKGTGQFPGEPTVPGRPGYGNSNAPAHAPKPADNNTPGTNVFRG